MTLKELVDITKAEIVILVQDRDGKLLFNPEIPLDLEERGTANMTVVGLYPVLCQGDQLLSRLALNVTVEKQNVMDHVSDANLMTIIAEFSEEYAEGIQETIMEHAKEWQMDKTAAAMFRAWKGALESARRDMTYAAATYANGEDGAADVKLARYRYEDADTLRRAIYTVLVWPVVFQKRGEGKA